MITIASVAIVLSIAAVSESLETSPNVFQDTMNAGNNVLSSNILYQMTNEVVALKNRLDKHELEMADLRERLSDSEEKVKEQEYLMNGFKADVTELKSKIQIQDKVILELVAKMDKTDRKGTDEGDFPNNTVVLSKDLRPETDKIYGKLNDDSPLNVRRRQLNETGGYVAFTAYLDHDLNYLITGHVVKCNQVLTNMGNHYNKNTGVFTVPTTGVYLLTFFINGKGTSHITFVKAVVDNREIVAAVSAGASWDVTGGNSAIVQLNAGQAVWLEIFGTTQGSLLSNGNYRYVTFSGVLLF